MTKYTHYGVDERKEIHIVFDTWLTGGETSRKLEIMRTLPWTASDQQVPVGSIMQQRETELGSKE
jgi:hypothetical protein